MVDTTTSWLKLVKQTIGGNRNTWGGILNNAMDIIEGAVAGMTSKVVTGGSVTLSDDEYRSRILNFTGTLASEQNIVVPSLSGKWTIRNGTSGDFALKVKTLSGTGVEVPQGGWCEVWCDGGDTIYVGPSSRLFDTQFKAPSGTLAAPGQSWLSEITSGVSRLSAGVFAWVIAGVARVTIGATQFAITLADTGTVTIQVDATTVVTVSETGVAIIGNLTVNGSAPTPIGVSDTFEGIRAPNGWLFMYGQTVSRSTYSLLLAELSEAVTATRSNGSNTLTAVSEDLQGLGLVGATIEGTGIPSGTTITAIAATTITMSQNASGAGAITATIFPHGNGDGATTFNIPDDRGYVNPGRDDMGGTPANRLTNQSGGINGSKLGGVGGSETVTLAATQIPSHTHTATVTDPGHAHNYLGTAQNGTAEGSFAIMQSFQTRQTDLATTGITVSNSSTGGGGAHNNVQPGRVTNKIIFTGVFA